MPEPTILGIGGLLVAFAAYCWLTRDRPRVVQAWLDARQGPITGEVRRAVAQHLTRRALTAALGSLVGFTVSVIGSTLVRPDPTMALAVVFGCSVLGLLLGGSMYAVGARRVSHGSFRVARATAPHVRDYVNPTALALLRLGVLWGLTVKIVVAAVWARRIVNLPQPADDPVHLFWDDALRADLVERLYRSYFCLVVLMSIVDVGSLTSGAGAPLPTRQLTGSLGLWFVVAYVLVLGGQILTVPQRRSTAQADLLLGARHWVGAAP